MAVEHEVLPRFTGCEVLTGYAGNTNRHSAHVLLAVRLRRGICEPDPRVVDARRRKNPHTMFGSYRIEDRKLRAHTAGSAPLVEALHGTRRMSPGAHLLQERDEGCVDARFVRIDLFFCKPQRVCSHVGVLTAFSGTRQEHVSRRHLAAYRTGDPRCCCLASMCRVKSRSAEPPIRPTRIQPSLDRRRHIHARSAEAGVAAGPADPSGTAPIHCGDTARATTHRPAAPPHTHPFSGSW